MARLLMLIFGHALEIVILDEVTLTPPPRSHGQQLSYRCMYGMGWDGNGGLQKKNKRQGGVRRRLRGWSSNVGGVD